MGERGEHQIAKVTQDVGTNGPLFVVSDGPPNIRLLGVYAEMVQPEPHQLLAELVSRVNRPQEVSARSLVAELVGPLVHGFSRLVLLGWRCQGVDALLRGRHLQEEAGSILSLDLQLVDWSAIARGSAPPSPRS